MKQILSLIALLTLTAAAHGADAISTEPVTHQIALRMYSLIDAQVAQLPEDIINTLADKFSEAVHNCTESVEERTAIHKENTRFAIEQAVYFRRQAANILVDIAYESFESSLPADAQERFAQAKQLEQAALTWNYVAIALLAHAEKDPAINKAQESLATIKNLLAR